jgi:hypothetical protein
MAYDQATAQLLMFGGVSETQFLNSLSDTWVFGPVSSPPLQVTTTSLPNGAASAPYSATLQAANGNQPYTWAVTVGSTPRGLTLDPSSGTIAGTASAAGTWYFTAQVTDFSNPAQTASRPLSITIDPGTAVPVSETPNPVSVGSNLTATWKGIPSPSATDWIGIYSSSAASDRSYLNWHYTTGTASGSVSFSVPPIARAGTTYELRLFSNNGWTRLGTSPLFTVAPALSESPNGVPVGSNLTATWMGIASPTSTDWVGLYPSSSTDDHAYVNWHYTTGTASGSVSFSVPPTASRGTTYELRLFSNNGWSRIGTSPPFTVQ